MFLQTSLHQTSVKMAPEGTIQSRAIQVQSQVMASRAMLSILFANPHVGCFSNGPQHRGTQSQQFIGPLLKDQLLVGHVKNPYKLKVCKSKGMAGNCPDEYEMLLDNAQQQTMLRAARTDLTRSTHPELDTVCAELGGLPPTQKLIKPAVSRKPLLHGSHTKS